MWAWFGALGLGLALLILLVQAWAGAIVAAVGAALGVVFAVFTFLLGKDSKEAVQGTARQWLRRPRVLRWATVAAWLALAVAAPTWWFTRPEPQAPFEVEVVDNEGRPVEAFTVFLTGQAKRMAAKTGVDGRAEFLVRRSQLGAAPQLEWTARTGPGQLLLTAAILKKGEAKVQLPFQPPPFRVRYLRFAGADALVLAERRVPQALSDSLSGRITLADSPPLNALVSVCEAFHPGFKDRAPTSPTVYSDEGVDLTINNRETVHIEAGSKRIAAYLPRCFYPFYGETLLPTAMDLTTPKLTTLLANTSDPWMMSVVPAACWHGSEEFEVVPTSIFVVRSPDMERVKTSIRTSYESWGARTEPGDVERAPFGGSIEAAAANLLTHLAAQSSNEALAVIATGYAPPREDGCGDGWQALLSIRVPVVEAVLIQPMDRGGFVNWGRIQASQGPRLVRGETEAVKAVNAAASQKVPLLPEGNLAADEAILIVTRFGLEWPDAVLPDPAQLEQCRPLWRAKLPAAQNGVVKFVDAPNGYTVQRRLADLKLLEIQPDDPMPLIYGPLLQLTSLSWDGFVYPVRPANFQLHASYIGYEMGSCPHAYAVRADGGRRFLGELFPGASAREKKRLSRHEIGDSANGISIVEEDAERTFIDELYLEAVGKDGRRRRIDFERPKLNAHDETFVVLDRGQALNLPVPQAARDGARLTLVARGYYEPYGHPTASNPTRGGGPGR